LFFEKLRRPGTGRIRISELSIPELKGLFSSARIPPC
jgi:hypothetical protein